MSAPKEININFQYLGSDYFIQLIKEQKSDYSVVINGFTYAVQGEQEKLDIACKILKSVSLDSISNVDDLKGRLSSIEDITFHTQKIQDLSTKSLQKKLEKANRHLELLKSQKDHAKRGSSGRAKKASLNVLIDAQEKSIEKLRSDPQIKIIEAYEKLFLDLTHYAEKNLKQGALLVQVVGVPGSEKPLTFGKRSVSDAIPIPVDERTIGRTGSGAKLWAGLLTNVLTSKYEKYIQMQDGFVKFAPNEALKKFGRIDSEGKDFLDEEYINSMTVEGIVGMMAGLEYEQPKSNNLPKTTLDQLMRGKEIRNGSIHILHNPSDKINVYTNNICFIAYPIEKAYKKVLAAELIEKNQIDEYQTLRNLSPQLQPFRSELQEKIKKAEEEIDSLCQLGASENIISPYENRLHLLKADLQNLFVSESSLDITLRQLMDCETAYTAPPNSAYIYDLIDLFLMPSNNHRVDYAEIMKRELLGPLGMENSGFRNVPGIHMDVTYENNITKKDESYLPDKDHPMVYGAGFGRTSLYDASKLAKGLSDPSGLVANDGKTLLTPEELDNFFKPHGHYEGWGLGGAELTCNGKVVDKGGSLNQDQYTFWVDRESGIGMIALCNCGRRPDKILNAFKSSVENINYPKAKYIVKEIEGSNLGIPTKFYFDHLLDTKDVKQLFEGTRGRIALLFDYDVENHGIVHWSGTPLKVVKQEDGAFCVTTPGRFKGLIIRKIIGIESNQNYLAVGDTSFIEIGKDNLPSQEQIEYAQREFSHLCGKYINQEHLEYGVLEFEVLQDKNGHILLGARDGDEDFVAQNIVKVEPNSIMFNGHDRQPPDKIFRFLRKSEFLPWQLEVLDYASKQFIEERPKS